MPLSSVTTPNQTKRLYIDPRLLPVIEGRRVALIDDVISSGASMLAGTALLAACGCETGGSRRPRCCNRSAGGRISHSGTLRPCCVRPSCPPGDGERLYTVQHYVSGHLRVRTRKTNPLGPASSFVESEHYCGASLCQLRSSSTAIRSLSMSTPTMPVLWAVREAAGLHGTKFGCGMALCGACTIHLDGQAVRSCVLPALERRQSRGDHHRGVAERPLRKRFRPPGSRCRCRSAVTVSPARSWRPRRCSKATVRRATPTSTGAMSGNICRCATYSRIRAAIHSAAESLRTSESMRAST